MRYIVAQSKLQERLKRNNSKGKLGIEIANLSHLVFKTKGQRGHNIRQSIRKRLKSYAYPIIYNNRCPKCGSTEYKRRNGFHLFGINQYHCFNCKNNFTQPNKKIRGNL